MNELLKINYDEDRPTVSGRELHQALEVATPYPVWFPRMREYGFTEGESYLTVLLNRSDGLSGKPLSDHQLAIDMAKEIAMLQRNEKGKRVRQYFIEVEKKWNSPDMQMARGLMAAQRMLADKDKVIAALIPKAEFFDAVADSKSAISMGEVAKIIGIPGIGQNNLFRFLRQKNILLEDNTPYQVYIDRGYFRVIEQFYEGRDGDKFISKKTLVYQRGVDYIRRKLNETRERELYGV